jgi:hypothetical protein
MRGQSKIQNAHEHRGHGIPARMFPVCGAIGGAAALRGRAGSAGNDEIYGLGTLAFLIGFHVEADALPLNKRFQPCTFNSSDVNEHIAATVVRLDEAIAAFSVEEFDRTGHCH